MRLAPLAPVLSRLVIPVLGTVFLAAGVAWPLLHYVGQSRGFMTVYSVELALWGCASWLVFSGRTDARLGTIILLAVAFRLSLVAFDPWLSDDLYRYVWDGRVQAAGFNPYRYIPADDALAGLRDSAIYGQINRRDYAPTVYPPGAEALFLGVHVTLGGSLVAMKAALVAFDIAAVGAL